MSSGRAVRSMDCICVFLKNVFLYFSTRQMMAPHHIPFLKVPVPSIHLYLQSLHLLCLGRERWGTVRWKGRGYLPCMHGGGGGECTWWVFTVLYPPVHDCFEVHEWLEKSILDAVTLAGVTLTGERYATIYNMVVFIGFHFRSIIKNV